MVAHVIRVTLENPQIPQGVVPVVAVYMVNHVSRPQLEMLTHQYSRYPLTLPPRHIRPLAHIPEI